MMCSQGLATDDDGRRTGNGAGRVITALDALFEPITIGKMTLRNRCVMSPMTRCRSPGGVPAEDSAAYYGRRVTGGVGLVFTEGVGVDHPTALGCGTMGEADMPVLHGAEALDRWRGVVDAVHAEGGVVVHAFPFAVPDRKFEIDPDRQSCSWSIVLREREAHETEGLLPHMGGKMRWFRQRSWRKAVAKKNKAAETMVKVKAYGIGASLSKSEWWQPSLGLHLLSLLYVTPIDPFRYEVFANCGVKTFRSYRPKLLQRAMNQLGTWFHLWANIHFAKYDDLPYYNRGKIRLNSPAYMGKDMFLKGYVDWWKSEFFSPEYKKMIEGYDLDFE